MYRWVEHTGELELEIEAETEDAVYVEAMEAIAELLAGEPDPDAPATGGSVTRDLSVEAPDRARLLAEFLSELVYLADAERLIPEGLERLIAAPPRLQATVRGRIGDPAQLVKAVTYHQLAFDPVDGGWRARVVLDV